MLGRERVEGGEGESFRRRKYREVRLTLSGSRDNYGLHFLLNIFAM